MFHDEVTEDSTLKNITRQGQGQKEVVKWKSYKRLQNEPAYLPF
jgi:hypothetical protein